MKALELFIASDLASAPLARRSENHFPIFCQLFTDDQHFYQYLLIYLMGKVRETFLKLLLLLFYGPFVIPWRCHKSPTVIPYHFPGEQKIEKRLKGC